MIIGARRTILIGAIAAVVITIILLPLIFSYTVSGLDRVTIELSEVEVGESRNKTQILPVTAIFVLINPTSQALTTSKIEYELFANEMSLGEHTLSFEDVPPQGRPALFQNEPVKLPSSFDLQYLPPNSEIFNMIQNSAEQIEWSVQGTIRIEAALTLVDKPFSDDL